MDVALSYPEPTKENELLIQCNLCDKEVIRKIAQVLLQGLATACVDNTTGDLFKGPGSVAVNIRKEIVDYLTQRSESIVSETLIQEGEEVVELSDLSIVEIIMDLADDFASTKRNFLGQVSGWLLSDNREEKIDDFMQEMEMSGFWLMDRREVIAEILLRNIDYKNKYHCNIRFDTPEKLEHHKNECEFRSIRCTHEGCKLKFCAKHTDSHDSECPFKILPCEQNCSQNVMRRDMDRHCITVCPMKLINCPFHQVGCSSTIPLCRVEDHCVEFLHFHILHVLKVIHKKDALTEELKEHAILLEKSQSSDELSEALDVRSLTFAIKKEEEKIKKLENNIEEATTKLQIDEK